jgi:hypothetical protein
MTNTHFKILFTVVAIILLTIRIIRPGWLPADAVTVSLLIAAILPWLSSFLKSAKLPGGWDFVFQELQDKVAAQGRRIDDQQTIINRLVVFAASQHIFKHLSELYHRKISKEEYLFRNNPDFKRDLFYLRDNGYIESNVPGQYLNIDGLQDGQNLIEVIKLTPIGNFLVEIREQMEREA